jgi:short-subunit dehydrogenase
MTSTAPQPEDRPLAVVTGASSGIGLELARELAGQGHDLVVNAEDARIAGIAEELAGHGGTVVAVQADLATAAGVERLHAAVSSTGRPVAVAALNAGVGVGGRFDETDLDADLRLLDLNVRSTVHLAKLLLRDMVHRGSGRVLITASIAATMPGPFHATYAASKAFLHSFAEAIRTELKDTGVTVTSLMPGPTDTEFFARAGMEDTKLGSGPKDDPADVAREAVAALMAGKDHVVTGARRNSAMAGAATVLPDRAVAAAAARMAEPGSGSIGAEPGSGSIGAEPGSGSIGAEPGSGSIGAEPGSGSIGAEPGSGSHD